MIKINIMFVVIVAFLIIYSFCSRDQQGRKKKTLKKEKNWKIRPAQKENFTSQKPLDKNIKKTEYTEKQNSLKVKSFPSNKEKKKEKRKFKTADEAIKTMFPNIESELGEEMITSLKSHFPFRYMLRVIKKEQKKKYNKIAYMQFEDCNAIMGGNGKESSLKEISEMKAHIGFIKEFYLPKILNIMKKEQQEKMIKNMLSEYFTDFRKRKDQGISVVEDEVLNLEILQKSPKLQKLLEKRKKEFHKFPFNKK